MASTRAATGNSRPRIFETPASSAPPARKRQTTKTTKANTSKPRAPAAGTTSGRVTKKTTKPRKTGLKDKAEGALLKVEGKVERKPGKKAAGTKKIHGTDGKKKTALKK